MKGFYTHTHDFKLNNQKYYSSGGITDSALNRYTDFLENLVVGARVVNVEKQNTEKLSLITDTKVTFVKIDYGLKMFGKIKSCVSKSDIVITRIPSVYGVIAVYYARKLKKPIISEVVGNGFEAFWYYSFIGKFIAFPFHKLTKWAVLNSKYVIYITFEYLQYLYKTNGKYVSGISNISINEKEFNYEKIVEKRLKQISLEERVIKIGMIGNLQVKYKGHIIAIKMFKNILKRHPNIIMEFVGNGDKTKLLKYAKSLGIDKQVIFKGTLSHSLIFEWLDTVDIYIQPSKTEAQGRSVIEAMSRGCAIVVSNVGGLKENIDEKFRFDSLLEFEKIIDLLLKSPKIEEAQIKQNLEFVKRFFSSNIESKRLLFLKKIFKNEVI